MDCSAKILLLGKTGVGKSSFINYFLGKDVAKSAYGKPETQEMTSYEYSNGKYPIKIFDTKGLEALNANNQLNEIMETIKRRNNSDDIFNWFHTIFYCISMSDSRFQEFECNFIKRLQNELSQHIHIILTHCDSCSENDIRDMKNKIMSDLGNLDNIEIFEVVSISIKKRNGTEVKPCGREEVSERVFDLLSEDISRRLSVKYASELRWSLSNIADDTLRHLNRIIDETANLRTLIDIFNGSDLNSELDNYSDKVENDIENAIKNTDRKFNEILQPLANMFASYKSEVSAADLSLNFSDWNFDEINYWINGLDVDDLMEKVMPNTAKFADTDFENESLFSMAKMLFGGISDLLKIKKRLKSACSDMCYDFKRHIPTEEKIRDEAYERILDFFDEID